VTVSDHRDLVSALLGVAGVAAAALERGEDDDGLGSLRLQLVPGADEVAVAGAVNRLLRARFGLAVDTDRVRVLDEPAPAAPEPDEVAPDDEAPGDQAPGDEGPDGEKPGGGAPGGEAPGAEASDGGAPSGVSSRLDQEAGPAVYAAPDVPVDGRSPLPDSPAAPRAASLPTVHIARAGRLTIQRVQMVSAGLGVVATVQLGFEGGLFDGQAEGAATATGVHRSVAVATLRAIEGVVAGRARFEVEHLEVTLAGHDRTALVVLTMLTDRGSERLSGASVVREDVRQAVIRAVLATVNRKLEPMLDEM
jgi:hypothetical protein